MAAGRRKVKRTAFQGLVEMSPPLQIKHSHISFVFNSKGRRYNAVITLQMPTKRGVEFSVNFDAQFRGSQIASRKHNSFGGTE
jgi:hypothetical protein